ncbi:MAG: hypothetical protein R6U78_00625 [Bacteroidales bacterium]
MKRKVFLNAFSVTVLMALLTMPVNASPYDSYDPVGTWEYSAPNVTPGYTTGEMIIENAENGFRVILSLDQYNQMEARDLKFEEKSMTFNLYVEGEFVTVSGKFDKDTFTGTVSYSEGVFDLTATRKKDSSEE